MDQTTIEILKLVVTAAIALIVVFIRKDLIPFIQSKTTAEQFRTAQEMTEMFVYMAQQIFKDKTGKEKKQIVKDALSGALNNAGINLTDQFIDDMIEAANAKGRARRQQIVDILWCHQAVSRHVEGLEGDTACSQGASQVPHHFP